MSSPESDFATPAKQRVTFGGYSDDIVFVNAPNVVDEYSLKDGDQIHIRFPSGAKIIVLPEFGRDGWEFHIDVPHGTEVEYEHGL